MQIYHEYTGVGSFFILFQFLMFFAACDNFLFSGGRRVRTRSPVRQSATSTAREKRPVRTRNAVRPPQGRGTQDRNDLWPLPSLCFRIEKYVSNAGPAAGQPSVPPHPSLRRRTHPSSPGCPWPPFSNQNMPGGAGGSSPGFAAAKSSFRVSGASGCAGAVRSGQNLWPHCVGNSRGTGAPGGGLPSPGGGGGARQVRSQSRPRKKPRAHGGGENRLHP